MADVSKTVADLRSSTRKVGQTLEVHGAEAAAALTALLTPYLRAGEVLHRASGVMHLFSP